MNQQPLFEAPALDPSALILITRRDCLDYSGFGMELTKVTWEDGRWAFWCVDDRQARTRAVFYEHEIAAIVCCDIGVPDHGDLAWQSEGAA